MDRKKLALLTFAAVLAGGAWWYSRRSAAELEGAAAPDPDLFGDLAGPLTEFFAGLESAAIAAADTVMDAVAPGSWSPPAKAAPYLAWIYTAEDLAGAPRNLIAKQIQVESNYNPLAVNARSGAKGLGQFIDATWAEWGRGDVFDPEANIDATGRYMRWLYNRHGDWRSALAAYNWGTGNVARNGIGRAPTETRNYVAAIAGGIGLA